MKDYEFSSAGAEFDRSGQEISLPPPERSAPAEVDRSGREYQQQSTRPAAQKRKRRIRPAMATVAAAVTAVVAISPFRSVRTDYPNRVPGAEAREYLDYAVETVRQGDFDELLAAALDPRLEYVIREEFAPFAMELSQQYGVPHTACGNGGDSEDWDTLEEFVQAQTFHVGYDGTIVAWEADPDLAEHLTCSRWTPVSADGVQRLEAGFYLNNDLDQTIQQNIYGGVGVSSFGNGRRGVRVDWHCEELPLLGEEDEDYEFSGTFIEHWYNDQGESTERTDWYERISDGRYISKWVYDPDMEGNGYYTDYLENGTVVFRRLDDAGGWAYEVSLRVRDGVVQLSDQQSYEIRETSDGTRLISLYHHYTNSVTGEQVRTELHTAQIYREDTVLLYLF